MSNVRCAHCGQYSEWPNDTHNLPSSQLRDQLAYYLADTTPDGSPVSRVITVYMCNRCSCPIAVDCTDEVYGTITLTGAME